jgi:hypothetical protein
MGALYIFSSIRSISEGLGLALSQGKRCPYSSKIDAIGLG